MILEKNEGIQLWGAPLWVNIDPDGWIVGEIYDSPEEAEEAATRTVIRVRTIRIQ